MARGSGWVSSRRCCSVSSIMRTSPAAILPAAAARPPRPLTARGGQEFAQLCPRPDVDRFAPAPEHPGRGPAQLDPAALDAQEAALPQADHRCVVFLVELADPLVAGLAEVRLEADADLQVSL